MKHFVMGLSLPWIEAILVFKNKYTSNHGEKDYFLYSEEFHVEEVEDYEWDSLSN